MKKSKIKKFFNENTNAGYWHVFKNKVDICWYAICKCGFTYRCSKNNVLDYDHNILLPSQSLNELYHFCPRCGKKYKTTGYINYLDTPIPTDLWYNENTTYMDLIKYCNKPNKNIENI